MGDYSRLVHLEDLNVAVVVLSCCCCLFCVCLLLFCSCLFLRLSWRCDVVMCVMVSVISLYMCVCVWGGGGGVRRSGTRLRLKQCCSKYGFGRVLSVSDPRFRNGMHSTTTTNKIKKKATTIKRKDA